MKHYSKYHSILLVGEGDFSFSLCLANEFGSAANIVATSLDSREDVIKMYADAKSNLDKLHIREACILHGVDATTMKLYTGLKMVKFDRIIFNFPHAGFFGKEDSAHVIRRHTSLVDMFFRNASSMLRANGEIHVNHKTKAPFCYWNLEDIASRNSLALIEMVDFIREDYPGYCNKRGAGSRCDEPFHIGQSSTFKFCFSPTIAKRIYKKPVKGLVQDVTSALSPLGESSSSSYCYSRDVPFRMSVMAHDVLASMESKSVSIPREMFDCRYSMKYNLEQYAKTRVDFPCKIRDQKDCIVCRRYYEVNNSLPFRF